MSSGLRKGTAAAGMALGLIVVLLVLRHRDPASRSGPSDGGRPAVPSRQSEAPAPARSPIEVEPGILMKDSATGRVTAGGAAAASEPHSAPKLFKLPQREVPARESDALAALAALEQAGKSLEREALAAAWARVLASDSGRRSEFLRMLRATVDPELRRLQ